MWDSFEALCYLNILPTDLTKRMLEKHGFGRMYILGQMHTFQVMQENRFMDSHTKLKKNDRLLQNRIEKNWN